MMKGRGAIRGAQRAGSSCGPAISTVESPATATLAGQGMLRRTLCSSGAYDPPLPWIAHTRVTRGSSAPATVVNGTPRLTPTSSIARPRAHGCEQVVHGEHDRRRGVEQCAPD